MYSTRPRQRDGATSVSLIVVHLCVPPANHIPIEQQIYTLCRRVLVRSVELTTADAIVSPSRVFALVKHLLFFNTNTHTSHTYTNTFIPIHLCALKTERNSYSAHNTRTVLLLDDHIISNGFSPRRVSKIVKKC